MRVVEKAASMGEKKAGLTAEKTVVWRDGEMAAKRAVKRAVCSVEKRAEQRVAQMVARWAEHLAGKKVDHSAG